MFSSASIARRFGLAMLAVAVVGSVAACGSKSLMDNFTDKITASDFQAAGALTGSYSVAAAGVTYSATITGTEKIKGQDTSQEMTMSMAATDSTPASTSETDTITVGDSTYTRSDGGTWTKTARGSETDIKTVVSQVGLTDKGVESHFGQQLHRLESTKPVPDSFIFGDTTGISDTNMTLTFWAKDDGTPAGMTMAGTYTQDMSGTSGAVTISMEVSFDTLSGVDISAPSM